MIWIYFVMRLPECGRDLCDGVPVGGSEHVHGQVIALGYAACYSHRTVKVGSVVLDASHVIHPLVRPDKHWVRQCKRRRDRSRPAHRMSSGGWKPDHQIVANSLAHCARLAMA